MTATDLAALWAAAEAAPGDDGLKLVLADALAEAGDADAERAVRWCVANRKWPKRTNLHRQADGGYGRWGWFGQTARGSPPPDRDANVRTRLPFALWAWFLVRGEPAPGFLEFVRLSAGSVDFSDDQYGWSGPFPTCRDDDIRVVFRRLGRALEWAGEG